MKRHWSRAQRSLVFALVLTIAGTAFASRTGKLVLEVVDADGAALSDVAVTLESPKLQGFQFRETDALGRAVFPFLPPGAYVAEFVREGHSTIRVTYTVRAGASLVERVPLDAGEMTESVTVIGNAPLDVTDTGINHYLDEKNLQRVQVGLGQRHYQWAVHQAPGVEGSHDPNVHGSTLGENRYLIDGIDTTDPMSGAWGTEFNYDAIEAIELETGGFQAEDGQATGAIVNVITKSGGNELSGSFDVRYLNEKMVADSSYLDNDLPQSKRILGLTLGGPIVKDRLWWFVAAEDDGGSESRHGAAASLEYAVEKLFGKLRWQPHPDHRLDLQYLGNVHDRDNSNARLGVAPEALQHYERINDSYGITYWGRLDDRWALRAQAGRFDKELNWYPRKDSGDPARLNVVNGYWSGNYSIANYTRRQRDQLSAQAQYTSSSPRWHEVKFGFELHHTTFAIHSRLPGGSLEFVSHDPAIDGDPYGRAASPYQIQVLVPAPRLEDTGSVTSFHAQDTWHPTERITVDYGLRWDRMTLDRDDKRQVADFSLLQPRFGASFDLTGSRKHVVSFHAARMFDPALLIILREVNTQANETLVYRDAPPGECDDTNTFNGLPLCDSFGGASGAYIDEGLEATYVDELTAAYRHAVRPGLTLGARGIRRSTSDILENTLDSDGIYVFKNIPELKRRYRGLELDVRWDAARWHVTGSWTISSAEGHLPYTQGHGEVWDVLPFHSRNRYGPLPYDRRHHVKVQGWVELPWKLTLSGDFDWASGAPYDRVDRAWGTDVDGTAVPLPYGVEYVEPRGSRRRASLKTLNLQLAKAFQAGPVEIELIGAVLNLTKENRPTATNTTEVREPSPDTGELVVNGDLSTFGSPTAYQYPRSWEVGLRVSW